MLQEGHIPPFGSFGWILGAWTLWTFSTASPPFPREWLASSLHPTLLAQRLLQHPKAVALDIFLWREAPVGGGRGRGACWAKVTADCGQQERSRTEISLSSTIVSSRRTGQELLIFCEQVYASTLAK